MAVIFIIALATRVITNRRQTNTNCKTAIDSKQTIAVEHVDSVNVDSVKILQKNLDI